MRPKLQIPAVLSLLVIGLLPSLRAEERASIVDRNGVPLATSSMNVRKYPHGGMASHLIGYTSVAGEKRAGKVGIERKYQAELVAGREVRLTIDHEIQRAAEAALGKDAIGSAIVINPNSGEILALVSLPTFDGNLFLPAINQENWLRLARDPRKPLLPRSTHSQYAPVGVFSVTTALAACRAGLAESRFPSPSKIEIEKRFYRNWEDADRGLLTIPQTIMRSSNTALIGAAQKTGYPHLYETAKALGFGALPGTGIEGEAKGGLPGEAGRRRNPSAATELANYAQGSGFILASPLQVACAYSTIATRGKRFRPNVVARIGEHSIEPELLADLSDAKSKPGFDLKHFDTVHEGLVMAVNAEEGHSQLAKLPELSIAGTSGTSPFNREHSVSWFAGYAPASAPKWVVVIAIETKRDNITPAAPIAKEILKALAER